MMQRMPFTLGLADCRDNALVGGKAASLGRLVRAGFPVPDGFVLTTLAYRSAQKESIASGGNGRALPTDMAREILSAYRHIGRGPVAVRSSATAEDMAGASMAGQYETFLDIEGDAELLEAVERCWASLHSPRILSYLKTHDIDPSSVAMAVVIQRLVPADVAGVLFTVNPQTAAHREMLIEASWGLGESVVSGRVQPDVLRIERETGRVLAATIAEKHLILAAGAGEEREVEESRRRQPCLRGADVHQLWRLGRAVADHFGKPQDIEWAIHGNQLYLLQSRAITTLDDAEAQEEILHGARERLREKIKNGRGPWVVHNLAETLPHPTPLTWSVIRNFMTGAGGFGLMYRQVGFEPSPAVQRDGFLDPIGGRIYMDASLAPEMFFENFPFAYDSAELKRSPDASQTPPTLPTGTFSQRTAAARKLAAVNAKLLALSGDLDRRLNAEIFPAFAAWCAQEKKRDLAGLTPAQLVDLWREREKAVLSDFAPQSLLPSLVTGMASADLRTALAELFWDEDPDALSQLISSGGPPNRTVTADAELFEAARNNQPLDQWIVDHGHRAAGEFDLAAPRWREQPAFAREMGARLSAGEGPLVRHQRHGAEVNARIDALRSRLNRREKGDLDRRIDLVRRYIAFREDGKDFLMLGYDLLRDLALEAGRRLDVGEDIFYLGREDLFDALHVGYAPHHLIERRKRAYRAEARVSLPEVIDEQAIDSIGEPVEVKHARGFNAFAVSSHEAVGPARVIHSPSAVGDIGRGYILVCPSTDPSWTPLFVNAAGVVLERGGTLSHGAVVAREMGLAAVVLPDATRLFRDGEDIRVDGRRGWVSRISEESADARPAERPIDTDDTRVPHELAPPPAGHQERISAKIRNIFSAVWAAYLLAAFALPQRWLYDPSLRLLDTFLWPIARGLGKPAVVAVVAATIAALTLVVQKLVTDNRRLLEAKRRAAILKSQAQALPPKSARRIAFFQAANPVQWRVLAAAMVPAGILLGPMVMTFAWLAARVDPSVWPAPAGSAVQVVATVDGEWTQPIFISVPAPMQLDESTPASRAPAPIRRTLERLLSLYRQPRADAAEPWELRAAPDLAREQSAADLQAYLDGGIAPQGLTWLVRAPENWAGRFPVAVASANGPPATVSAVLGERDAPAPTTADGAHGSPVRELKIVYPRPAQEPVFWTRAFERAAGWTHLSAWLLLYVIVYIPALALTRVALKVA
ncbi:MAG TPA: PEP/pyruvate-binding domain-containing protein [Tepidisphaeraceae bacterium]|jgi:pyruvate,water dikinase|nr:PEP/pyruvate-binding domain-containing protein [Tepidisphaeraceae bacterium]